ncbi:MAG: anthranilate phosphoribosyltransferase [Chloroflexi bacterium]|nr:anthranilate phosphoribosyltransferase [Chloroflexota bacterium]
MIAQMLARVYQGQDLTADEAESVMDQIMSGEFEPAQFGAFVACLGMKGETADEVAGLARAMRRAALALEVAGEDHIDTCGTGGDGKNTFNVSTAAALIAAAAGAVVAKHGNRAASSRSGSADVLEALGARIDLTPRQVGDCISRVGIGFLFAQSFHPAMRHAGPLRAQIGIPTVFNILGPLTNPAGARRQLLGVARPELLDLVAGALARLGTRRALVVHGLEGLDEISIAGPTRVFSVRGERIEQFQVRPSDFDLKERPLAEVAGGDPVENAEIIRAVFAGESGPPRDFMLLNAAAALLVAGRANDLGDGVALARATLDSGDARRKLADFTAATHAV